MLRLTIYDFFQLFVHFVYIFEIGTNLFFILFQETTLFRLGLRLILVSITGLIVIVIPNFAHLMSLIGATCCTLLGNYIFPNSMEKYASCLLFHLIWKKLRSISILWFWLEKLNCGFFSLVSLMKKHHKTTFLIKISV